MSRHWYVNAYRHRQEYGGPEEGGWWYSVWSLEANASGQPASDLGVVSVHATWELAQEKAEFCREGQPTGHDYLVVEEVCYAADPNWGVTVEQRAVAYKVEPHPAKDHDSYPEGGWS